MKAQERKNRIIDLLVEQSRASVEELAASFSVSKMTIHRDLDELESAGLLRKIRGGASIEPSAQFESGFRYRERRAIQDKQRIAQAAAALIEPGMCILLDDGSTTGMVADHLATIRPLTVITNNLSVVTKLAQVDGINLITLGGNYSRKFNGFFGLLTEAALRELRVDLALVSSSAIVGSKCFHQDQEVIQSKRLMVAAAHSSCLLVDHQKFTRTALHYFADLNSFEQVITSRPPTPEIQETLTNAGVHLRIAPH